MQKFISTTVSHAIFLLRRLGFQRCGIVVIYWLLRRYRRFLGPIFNLSRPTAKPRNISRDPLLVYQMSKVGSTSLLYSLQFAYAKAGLADVPMYHSHTLTNLDLHEKLVTEANGPAHQLALVHEYKQMRRMFEARGDQRWAVVSLVRDPVARQVSDFFHHIDRHLPGWRQRWREGSLGIDQVIESFLTVGDPTLHWFEAETNGVLGIDVYASAFPHENGYCLYSRPPKVRLMVIRLEDLDRVAPTAVKDFLGIERFKLYPFNLGSESDYGEIYKQFKTRPLPAWYLERTYSSRMPRHFYTQAELERFTEKWSRPSQRD